MAKLWHCRKCLVSLKITPPRCNSNMYTSYTNIICKTHIFISYFLFMLIIRVDFSDSESTSEEKKASPWTKTGPENNLKLPPRLGMPAQLPSGADLPSLTGRTSVMWSAQLKTLCAAASDTIISLKVHNFFVYINTWISWSILCICLRGAASHRPAAGTLNPRLRPLTRTRGPPKLLPRPAAQAASTYWALAHCEHQIQRPRV